MLKGSWKTTVLGWLGLVTAVGLAATALLGGDGAEGVDWNGLWESVIVVFPSLAAIFARDNNVSSEAAGAN